MRKDIADKWVKALRGGEYEQGKDSLQSMNGFCCLGVLCDLAAKNNVLVNTREGSLLVGNYLADQKPVMEWSGVTTTKGDFGVGSLADMNENGSNFNELADTIEAEWEQL